MSNPLPHDHIIPFRDSEKTKKEQVADMFDKIAGKYDKMNRFLSARTDIGWRKKAIRLLGESKPRYILDVATGTADMAIMACKMLNPEKITGIDISEGMLELGRKKIEKEQLGEKIQLQLGDSETINFAENTFDAVMVAFGVRNFENLENGLAEMWRVLRPGGRLIVLEFSKPRNKAIHKLYNLYMGIVAPQAARWFKQNKEAYQYLNRSANAFPDRHLFTDILKKVGYSDTEFKPLSLGICCIYSGQKTCLTGRQGVIRSISLLLCGGVLFAQSVAAQYYPYSKVEMNRTDQDSKPYYFGMSLGINLARFQTELHPVFLQNDSVYVAEPINSGGITLGFQATARLSDRFAIRFNPQLMFVERNIFYQLKYPDINGDTAVTKKVESIIAAFPFQLKFQSDRIGNFRVYTLLGIKADIDMASNARAKKAEDLVKIEKYDWGPEFGIGFNFYFPSFIFSPEIKISNGMRNIHARDPNLRFSSVFDKIQSRMIVFTIHLEG